MKHMLVRTLYQKSGILSIDNDIFEWQKGPSYMKTILVIFKYSSYLYYIIRNIRCVCLCSIYARHDRDSVDLCVTVWQYNKVGGFKFLVRMKIIQFLFISLKFINIIFLIKLFVIHSNLLFSTWYRLTLFMVKTWLNL